MDLQGAEAPHIQNFAPCSYTQLQLTAQSYTTQQIWRINDQITTFTNYDDSKPKLEVQNSEQE